MTIWLCNPFDNLPEEGGRHQRYALLGRALVRRGHRVVWWTADFRHATKQRRTFPARFINADGVEMRLLSTLPYSSNIGLPRILSHRAFAANWRDAAKKAVEDGSLSKPDLVVTSLPPLGTASVAQEFRRWWRCRYVVDIQDAWPENFYSLLPRFCKTLHVLRLLERKAEKACRNADAVTAVARRYAERFLAFRSSVPVYIAYLGIDLPASNEQNSSPENFPAPRLVYIGNMGRSYDLETLVDVAKETGWRLDLAGTGPQEAALRTLSAGSANIAFHGFLAGSELRMLLHEASIGVIPMFNASCVAVPNKIADYAAAGLGILNSLNGEARELIDRYEAGTSYRAGDKNDLRRAVQSMPKGVGAGARKLAKECFDAEIIYPKFAAFLESVPGRPLQDCPWERAEKRLFDLTLTLLSAPLWFPVLAVTALFVWLTQGRPLFFAQERPGLHGKPFRLLKFRTMRPGEEPDAERLTKAGRFLRASSLDELPELFNVLRGEMSLVGPRPLLLRYLSRYTPEQARRNDVLPGITGWAQVHGRNAMTWEKKFAYDVWYEGHHNLGLDIQILLMTIGQVLLRRGINMDGEATASEFMGTRGDGE